MAKSSQRTADLMYINWKSKKQDALRNLMRLSNEFKSVAQTKDTKAIDLIEDEKGKLGYSLVFEKYLKSRVFMHLRFRVI